MSIKIVVSNKVAFKVKGNFKNEEGAEVPFDFTLKCDRLTTDEMSAKIKNSAETVYADFMVDVVFDWTGVLDEEGKSLPFSEEKFRELCQIPGLPALIYSTYVNEIGVKAKN